MWEWIQGHVAVILICAVLAAIVVLIIRGLVRDRKKGKSTCGANCAHCAMAGSCHGGTHPAESTRSRTEKAQLSTVNFFSAFFGKPLDKSCDVW